MKKKKDAFDRDITRMPLDADNPMLPLLQLLGRHTRGGRNLFGDARTQANELVYEAFQTEDDDAAFELVQTALMIDPDCILAYEYLAECEVMPTLSIPQYAYGVQLGRRLFGGKFLKRHKGEFWGFVETRPFLRCLYGYGRNCYYLGRRDECRAAYRELLALNTNDNQGVRYELGAYLLEAGDGAGYATLREQYRDDNSALLLYSDALHAFSTDNGGTDAVERLRRAVAANPHVPKLLLAKDLPEELPDSYQPGSPEEAAWYASFAWTAWQVTPGAGAWLKKTKPAAKRGPKNS